MIQHFATFNPEQYKLKLEYHGQLDNIKTNGLNEFVEQESLFTYNAEKLGSSNTINSTNYAKSIHPNHHNVPLQKLKRLELQLTENEIVDYETLDSIQNMIYQNKQN